MLELPLTLKAKMEANQADTGTVSPRTSEPIELHNKRKLYARRTLHNTAKVTCHYRLYLRNTPL
jgi:hypothetical protein